MELRQLRTFEAVVAQRTITDAAHALGLAPSSVSAQIRALESGLGVALFARGPRGMRLTPAGERMLVWARRLLDEAERARRDVAGATAAVRLGALETIAGTLVPDVLARLAARRPDVRVDVRSESARDPLLDGVAAGGLDAALLLDTGDALGELGFPTPPAPLEFLDVAPVPLALVAAPDHPAGGRKLLVNVPGCSFRLAADRLFGPEVERVAAGSVAVMRAWAQRGLGMSLLPEFAVRDQLAAGSLVRLGVDAPELALRLVWRGDRAGHPELRELLYAASA
jgi:DNA-binding transcriptional LysR family regulator